MALLALPKSKPRINRVLTSAMRQETINNRPSTNTAPLMAINKTSPCSGTTPVQPNKGPNQPAASKAKATPKEAPELMPNTKGPAMGFLKKVCINSPLTLKLAPLTRAAPTLGIRNCQMMAPSPRSKGVPQRAAQNRAALKVVDPTHKCNKAKANTAPKSPNKICPTRRCFIAMGHNSTSHRV